MLQSVACRSWRGETVVGMRAQPGRGQWRRRLCRGYAASPAPSHVCGMAGHTATVILGTNTYHSGVYQHTGWTFVSNIRHLGASAVLKTYCM